MAQSASGAERERRGARAARSAAKPSGRPRWRPVPKTAIDLNHQVLLAPGAPATDLTHQVLSTMLHVVSF